MKRFRMNRLNMGILATVCLLSTNWAIPTANAAQAPLERRMVVPVERPEHPDKVTVESSVKVDRQTIRRASLAAREAFAGVLNPYARVSLEQARLAVEKSNPRVELQDISLNAVHGNLVYIALLGLSTSGVRRLVFVDAGNARILATRDLPIRRGAPPRLM